MAFDGLDQLLSLSGNGIMLVHETARKSIPRLNLPPKLFQKQCAFRRARVS